MLLNEYFCYHKLIMSLSDINLIIDNEQSINNSNFTDNTLPKIDTSINKVVKYVKTQSQNTSTNATTKPSTSIIFIDSNNESQIQLLNNENYQALATTHHLYLINLSIIKVFINDVLNTDSKYVYPTVFVNFTKKALSMDRKIIFDEFELMKLRVWANQLRIMHGFEPTASSHHHNKRTNQQYTTDELFVGYTICCEMIQYAIDSGVHSRL